MTIKGCLVGIHQWKDDIWYNMDPNTFVLTEIRFQECINCSMKKWK